MRKVTNEEERPLEVRVAPRPSARFRSRPALPGPDHRWASSKDWTNKIREEVTRLYLHEDRPLKEVITFMAERHNHYATKRMYITRLHQWGLIKNKKESDMLFVLQTYNQRQAAGKRTSFQVYGRPVTYDEAFYYFHRKKGIPDFSKPRPPTPPHVLYRTPSPPLRLQFSEELLYNVQSYYELSFTNGKWRFEDATCFNVQSGSTETDNLDKFLGCCQSATNFMESKDWVAARRMLSTGCSMIRMILQEETPNALHYVLEALLRLRQHGMYEVDEMIRRYISNMCNIILPKGNPWSAMWQFLGTIDPDDIGDAMLQCWKCANEAARRHLGMFDPWTISVMADYNHMRLLDYAKEALELQDVLLECEAIVDPYIRKVARAKILFNLGVAQSRCGQWTDVEKTGLEIAIWGRTMGGNETVALREELRGVYLAAKAQDALGKYDLAEANLRRSMDLAEKLNGVGDAWYVQQSGALEAMLRKAGRNEDADTVRDELAACIERYHADDTNVTLAEGQTCTVTDTG